MAPLVYKWFSRLKCYKNAGAGTYSSIFNNSCPVGKYYENFDGEITTLLFAID